MEELPRWKRHYQKRRGKAIEYLGSVCVNCGSKDSLEFDHIDPGLKSFSVGEYLTHSWAKVEPELKKCQLLCQDCHRTKSKVDGSLEKMKKAFETRIPNQVPRDAEGRFIAKRMANS
jgi:5-methylcytosine-specific restriction endonuclease McrA